VLLHTVPDHIKTKCCKLYEKEKLKEFVDSGLVYVSTEGRKAKTCRIYCLSI